MNATQSREETIANARRRIQEVATALKGLGDYHIDRAVQCYKLALVNNFTQGRKQAHVIAACLYIVCRQEKTMRTLTVVVLLSCCSVTDFLNAQIC